MNSSRTACWIRMVPRVRRYTKDDDRLSYSGSTNANGCACTSGPCPRQYHGPHLESYLIASKSVSGQHIECADVCRDLALLSSLSVALRTCMQCEDLFETTESAFAAKQRIIERQCLQMKHADSTRLAQLRRFDLSEEFALLYAKLLRRTRPGDYVSCQGVRNNDAHPVLSPIGNPSMRSNLLGWTIIIIMPHKRIFLPRRIWGPASRSR